MSCTRPLLLAVAIATAWFSLLVLTATPSQAASVQPSWGAPTTSADGTALKDLAGYKVYFGLASRTYGTPIDVGNTTTFTLSSLTGGLKYFFAVTAYDTSKNESALSSEVSFTPPLDSSLAANFTATPTSGTAPLAVTFIDTSTGNITAWSWNFGDGGTSTQHNLTYTYTSSGTFDVALTVSGGGLSASVMKKGLITVSQAPASSSGLVAAYSFDEGSGTSVNDTSGKGNNGTISGATWTNSGRYGKALVFDGVNNWVTVNDAASLDLPTGMTLEAWVYPTALIGGTTNGWRTVIMKEQSNQLIYSLNANSDANRPNSYVYTSSDLGVSGNAQLPLNTWTHLASTYDGAVLRLYVNGSQVGSRSLSGSIRASSYPLRIGGNSVWGEFFAGRIDEVRIYNRALSVAEIQGDMNKAIGAVTGGILTVQNQSAPLKVGDVGSVLSKSTASLDNAK
jgi:PKD repeat protein